jgi:trimethylamine-N-oxide reductase (cytochrome c)
MAEEVYSNLTNSGPVSVYVKDGKIVRVRPLVVAAADFKPWTIVVGGK